MKTINNIDDLSESAINKLYSFRNWADKMSEKCPEDGKELQCGTNLHWLYYHKKPPGVINQYAPGEFYAVTESDIWLMRYHKNILFAVNCKTTRKNKFEIKVFIFGN